jgi:hypothetical protein
MGRRDGIGTVPPAPKPRRVVLLAMPCSEAVDMVGALDVFQATKRFSKLSDGYSRTFRRCIDSSRTSRYTATDFSNRTRKEGR